MLESDEEEEDERASERGSGRERGGFHQPSERNQNVFPGTHDLYHRSPDSDEFRYKFVRE